jgi:hypothetical protein
MAVVINDFEVVPAPAPGPNKADDAQAANKPPPGPPPPQEVERMLRRQMARVARVEAS